ncbi:hypothetical protein M514_00441, partial [Trichuris suis]
MLTATVPLKCALEVAKAYGDLCFNPKHYQPSRSTATSVRTWLCGRRANGRNAIVQCGSLVIPFCTQSEDRLCRGTSNGLYSWNPPRLAIDKDMLYRSFCYYWRTTVTA